LLVERFDAPLDPLADETDADANTVGRDAANANDSVPLEEAWLRAWEASYRDEVVDAVADAGAARAETDGDDTDGRADAQLVFCIDTRSEVFRRHLEAAGDYETHGYAGFFGVPMRHEGYDAEASADACPPIVETEHYVRDRSDGRHEHERAAYDRWTGRLLAGEKVLKAVKSNAATAFSFVESAGSAYGAALAARTLLPERVHDLRDALDARLPSVPDFCAPSVDYAGEHAGVSDLPVGLTFEEKVEYAAAAFETMGWDSFARLVVFTGHASETANNPFDASLDCGACAGQPGGPNARVLAAICDDDAVIDALHARGHDIPEDTVFLAAEHNTTTDEVTLYDGDVPESHADDLERLRADLDVARAGATAERAEAMDA
ncbi:putative inorganic carbon transporter subunit DabA, partial [Halarchaeum acidiphilum]